MHILKEATLPPQTERSEIKEALRTRFCMIFTLHNFQNF